MDEIAADVGPQTPIGQVQGDSFCAHCNYNLFSQVIFRDERLKVPVCRCPECGGFTAAAALGMAQGRAQHRVAIGQVVVYVLFLILIFGVGTIVLFAFQADGMDMVNYASGNDLGWLVFWSGVFAFSGGIAVASFLWHIPGLWRFMFLAIPVLLSLISWNARGVNHRTPSERTALGATVLVQELAMGVGLVFGRIIARGLLTLLLPMGVRRYLGFLWLVDGKPPPS